MQFEYALLKPQDIHISKKVRKLIKEKNYEIKINNIKETIEKIKEFHSDNWIKNEYEELLLELEKHKSEDFELFSFTLHDKNTNEIIAGEIGYIIDKTYTSLSGFSSKEKQYRNWGKLQMVLLAQHLEKNSFNIWNLGHPYMQYKLDLAAKVYKRMDFLKIWLNEIKRT